jgi:integrase
MPDQSYSIHPRTTKKGIKIFYVQFRLPSGKWSNAKSTGQTDRIKAERWVNKYLNKGRPVLKKNVTLSQFSGKDFFTYGNPWELDKRIGSKKKPSPRWCHERTRLYTLHVLPSLGDYRLNLISEEVIKEFRNNLCIVKGFSGSYANKVLTTLREVLKAAYRKSLIHVLPEFELANVEERRRGKLTRHEVRKIFSFEWSDERGYIASLIAATTGARLSEIQALTIEDIGEDGSFTISKAWDRYTKTVKPRTKSGSERPAHLPQAHLSRVLRYIERHPRRNDFLFYTDLLDRNVPAGEALFLKTFYEALERIGITPEERKRRGISFHSWRYYANSYQIEAGTPETMIREMIGHADAGMTKRYYRTENIEKYLHVVEEAVPLPETDIPEDPPRGATH